MPRARYITLVLTVAIAVASSIVFFALREQHPRDHNRRMLSARRNTGGPGNSALPLTPSSASPVDSKPSVSLQQKQFIDAFATPITFYGRVLDQNGHPVSGAAVKVAANDKPFGGRPSQYVLETDETGSFAISGIVGLTLAIEVSKAGYEVIPPADGKVTSSGLFDYGLSSNREKPRPSKDTPVIFTLRKPGIREPLIKVNQRHFRIARDGSPLLISLDPEQAHKVILRCWTHDVSRPEGQRQYDWHLEITAQDGDLVRRTDGLNYEAPAQGYMGSDAIDMPASLPANEWHGIVERSYFIRFNDGVFARVTFEIHAGGDHFVVWSSFMNPRKGSRILE